MSPCFACTRSRSATSRLAPVTNTEARGCARRSWTMEQRPSASPLKTSKCIGGYYFAISSGGRTLAEHREQQQVVGDLEPAGDDERPAERRQRQQVAGQEGARRRREAARNGGDARGRRALLRRHDRHHVRAARGHVHLRQQAAHEQQRDHVAQMSGTNGIATRHRLAGRCVNTIVLTRPMRLAMRTATRYENALRTPVAKKIVPVGGERQVEALVQPERDHRLHDEAAAERVEAEQRGEREHGAARADCSGALGLGPFDSSARGKPAIGERQPRGRAARRATNIACSARRRRPSRRMSPSNAGTPAASDPTAATSVPDQRVAREHRRALPVVDDAREHRMLHGQEHADVAARRIERADDRDHEQRPQLR